MSSQKLQKYALVATCDIDTDNDYLKKKVRSNQLRARDASPKLQ